MLLACGLAQAEEITEKRLHLRLPEHLSRGQAGVQIRTGFDYTPGAGNESEFGVLLQPRLDARSGIYGHFFAVATTTGGVLGSDAASADPMLSNPGMTSMKQFYGGWSSGSLLGGLGEDALTVSVGRETVEDGGGILNWFSQPDSCDTGCWLRRRATGFRSLSANLTAGAIQQRVFYATSIASEGVPNFAGMSTTVTGSALEVGAGFAGSVQEDPLAFGSDHVLGRIGASYKLGEALPWSPVLSSGYVFAWRMPEEGVADLTEAEDPTAYARGARVVELGLSIQPAEKIRVKTGYSSEISERWLHGVDASAEWRPTGALALRMQGRISEADPEYGQPEDAEREASLNGTLDVSF